MTDISDLSILCPSAFLMVVLKIVWCHTEFLGIFPKPLAE